jgi:tetratricopeptide (TPR) repeat protein
MKDFDLIDHALLEGRDPIATSIEGKRFLKGLYRMSSHDFTGARKLFDSLAAQTQAPIVWLYAGQARQASGDAHAALEAFRQVDVPSLRARRLNGEGVCLHQLGRPIEAVKVLRQALEAGFAGPSARINLAVAFQSSGDPRGAWNELSKVSEDQLGLEELRLKLRLAQEIRNFVAMEECAYHLLTRAPEDSEAAFALAHALSALHRPDLEQNILNLLSQHPSHPGLIEITASVLANAGRSDYARALLAVAMHAVSPPTLHFAMAMAEYRSGKLDSAYALLSEKFNYDRKLLPPIGQPLIVPRLKLQHMLDQMVAMQSRGTLPGNQAALAPILTKVLNDNPENSPQVTLPPHSSSLKAMCNLLADRRQAEEPQLDEFLAERDWEAVVETFRNQPVPFVVIDGLLTAQALEMLHGYLMDSQVWTRSYERGYQATFLPTGFHSRTLLYTARELESRMVDRLAPGASLAQAWAFQHDGNGRGVNLHADFAQLNVNFWITPDSAVPDQEGGGLRIYDVPAPADWNFSDYNRDVNTMRTFLEEQEANYQDVAYRCNRAMIFDPRYFHATLPMHFGNAFHQRRINVTLLYGNRLQA